MYSQILLTKLCERVTIGTKMKRYVVYVYVAGPAWQKWDTWKWRNGLSAHFPLFFDSCWMYRKEGMIGYVEE